MRKIPYSEIAAWLAFVGFIAGALWLWSWTTEQDAKWRKVEAVEQCQAKDGQTASVSVKDGVATCAIMGWCGGRRVVIDRRSISI